MAINKGVSERNGFEVEIVGQGERVREREWTAEKREKKRVVS